MKVDPLGTPGGTRVGLGRTVPPMSKGQRRRSWFGGAAVVTIAVLAASCGSGTSSSRSTASTPTSPGSTGAVSKALGQGVTATSIRLGFVLIDYSTVLQFIHNTAGNQVQTYQVFVNDLNKHGGVLGRKIVPYYSTYSPIGTAGPLAACTSLTEDKKVFATIGVLYDATGAGQLCFVNQHKSILITHLLTQAVLNQVTTPGLLLTVDSTPEASTRVLLSLLKREHTLEGKTVAVLGEDESKASVASTVEPALKQLGVKMGSTAILTINGTDFTTAEAQLAGFIERWKTEGVDAVYMSGDDVVASQFVSMLRDAMPGVLLMTDGEASAQANGKAEPNPNPYAGMLTATNLPAQQNFEQPSYQACAKTYQAALGKPVIAPADVKPGPDGNKVEVYGAMENACADLAFFKYVAGKVGPDLNDQNWVRTIDNLGDIDNVIPGTHYASIHTGKYDASDDFGLGVYDPSVEDFRLTTPIENARTG